MVVPNVTVAVDKTYSVYLRCTDKFGECNIDSEKPYFKIPTEDVCLNLGKYGNRAAFGKYAEDYKTLEVAPDWNLKLKNQILNDFVVEEGTTDDGWTYRKWASGNAECWGVFTATFTGDNNAGGTSSVWNSNAITVDNYPFTFTEVPTVSFDLEDSGANCWGMKSNSTATSVGNIYALTGKKISSINPNGLTCIINIIAKGRWNNIKEEN